MNSVLLGNGIALTEDEIKKIQNDIFEVLKKDLGKDMCNYLVINYIISSLDDKLKEKTINL